jgi:ATP-dependent helicase/nuclease subunit A
MGCRDAVELARFSEGADGALIDDAIRLATRFDSDIAFEEFRLGSFEREVQVQLKIGELTLVGRADLVGDNYVLDFKTDSEMHPDGHMLQLWAYGTALNKPRAVIAYLRHGQVHEYSAAELKQAAMKASEVASGIEGGEFPARPSEDGCIRCLYRELCEERLRTDEETVF